jgi:predicted nuclease with TOPRIM domain
MAFTVNDFHDLVEILEKEPAWRAEVRRLVLTDDILGLPQAVRDLTASVQELSELQRHNEARFGRVEADISDVKTDVSQLKTSVGKLETNVGKLETNVGKLETNVGKLETNVGKLETNVGKLDTRMGKLETTVGKLETRTGRVETNVAKLNGRDLERLLRERPFVYLSRFALRLKAIGDAELAVLLEDAVERELLTEEEAEDAKLLDAVARGRRRTDAVPIYLAIEVSIVIDQHDLERSVRRAAIVEKASGVPTMPVVAGESILDDVRQTAKQYNAGWVILAQAN